MKNVTFIILSILILVSAGYFHFAKKNESQDFVEVFDPCLLNNSAEERRSCLVEKLDTFIPKEQELPDEAPLMNSSKTLETVYQQDNVEIQSFTSEPRTTSGTFVKRFANEHGIAIEHQFTPLEWSSAFSMGRGIASGDINNDFLPDLVLASSLGPIVYLNIGNFQFQYYPIDLPKEMLQETFIVAFVDINNDGLDDLYTTTYGGDNFFLLNDSEVFSTNTLITIPSSQRILTEAATFSDVDKDGDLDLFQGNWTDIDYSRFLAEYSANELFENNGATFALHPIEEMKGDTLTALFSDLNQDGLLELFIGNDFIPADHYYEQEDSFSFKLLDQETALFKETTKHTMSIETGDLNNDLVLDLFATDMSFTRHFQGKYCEPLSEDQKEKCLQNIEIHKLVSEQRIEGCTQFSDQLLQNYCLLAVLSELAESQKNPDLCEEFPDSLTAYKDLCLFHATKRETALVQDETKKNELIQVPRNMLYLSDDTRNYAEVATKYSVQATNWSWNAKFADLDNDGWQDIYIGNGFQANSPNPNVFYRNIEGNAFEESQDLYGLTDTLHSPSYTYADFDLDGDIDLIVTGINAPLRVYENQLNTNSSVTISLKDNQGNKRGIQSMITITDNEGKQQIRELKHGGGFLSFDIPVAYFGLNSTNQIKSIQIDWWTGTSTTLNISLDANRHYLIQRN